ncbi:hypothetical protein ACP4OV_023832 [Aristida adscensionis]
MGVEQGSEAEMMAMETPKGLNPDAREFVPSLRMEGSCGNKPLSADAPEFVMPARRRSGRNHWTGGRAPRGGAAYRRRRNLRPEAVKRTVFVADIDYIVTEDMLAVLFGFIGTVVDCRVCGDPIFGHRFAFIELQNEAEANAALAFNGVTIGVFPLRILPSRTAIFPINPRFLPQSEAEREVCLRTIYCSNIGKTVDQCCLKAFFEGYFGEISRLKVLGDDRHATNIAFIEFAEIDSAIAALGCTGICVGGVPIRISPSKTPIKSNR